MHSPLIQGKCNIEHYVNALMFTLKYTSLQVSDNSPVSTFLSSEGCGLGLSLLTDHHSYHQFLIAPKNKFLFFTADDPGNNLPMDGGCSIFIIRLLNFILWFVLLYAVVVSHYFT